MFDTLTYANKLKEAGFTERQAQAQAEALVAVVDSNLATKHDLKELELATKHDLKELESATKHDLKELELAIKHDLKELELKFDGKFLLIKHDLKELELKFEGKFLLVNWMLGFILAGTLSIILKTFFGH